jgi:hypothetical protein
VYLFTVGIPGLVSGHVTTWFAATVDLVYSKRTLCSCTGCRSKTLLSVYSRMCEALVTVVYKTPPFITIICNMC